MWPARGRQLDGALVLVLRLLREIPGLDRGDPAGSQCHYAKHGHGGDGNQAGGFVEGRAGCLADHLCAASFEGQGDMESARWLQVERDQHAHHRAEVTDNVSTQRHDGEVRIDAEDDEVGDDCRDEVTV